MRTALERIPRLALVCSFGAEDMVILDLLMKIDPEASVFYLDTDLFFPETYALRDEAVRRYGIPTALLRLEFAATSDFSRDDGAQSIQ
ncbi:MAG: Phosphoadenylyl-sulfate reductase [thioredoxin] [Candidatus Carbobacillus altaicus]|uniref:Phosphoadenylyl-sulfate reductase [thioredoxin] n=1 Tax=Candidatus Carbonibacillus altaicus TaxID=2163959 RepID=A0A2R6Y546_9BACL|nr:MAG: Phosphoadenylyl-sulfate reductase [thioredoxin] [Candidatus Carbobacillus altaicus]